MIWVAKNLYFFNCLLDGAHTKGERSDGMGKSCQSAQSDCRRDYPERIDLCIRIASN